MNALECDGSLALLRRPDVFMGQRGTRHAAGEGLKERAVSNLPIEMDVDIRFDPDYFAATLRYFEILAELGQPGIITCCNIAC